MTATRPDPNRLGGLAWTRRTGGRLTRRERARLLAAIGRGQWDNVAGTSRQKCAPKSSDAIHATDLKKSCSRWCARRQPLCPEGGSIC